MYRLALTFLLGTAACGDASLAGDGGAPPQPMLTIVGSDQIGLVFGATTTLRARHTSPGGAPIQGTTVSWTLVAVPPLESGGGSTLGQGTSTADADGIATVELTAGAARAQFRVRAQAAGAAPTLFYVTVSEEGFVSFEATPRQVGTRPSARIEVLLYAGVACGVLDPGTPPPSPFPTRVFDAFDHAAVFPALEAAFGYAVLGRSENAVGVLVGKGCVELGSGQLIPGAVLHFDLPIEDRPPTLASAYALTSTFDTRPAATAALAGGAWAAAACPLGPAQLLLDCALDELDGGDAADCAVTSPGPLAAALLALRGPVDAAGCRPATVAGGASLDARVMDALLGDGPALRSAAAALPSLLGTLELDSVLGVLHTLRRARLGTFEVDLVASARPVVATVAPLTVTGTQLTIGDHGFTLRLGAAARGAFRALLWDAAPDALGDVVGARCDAASAAACGAAAQSADCLTSACHKGATAMGAALALAFQRLDGAALDFRLAGSAVLVDANQDQTAETTTAGAWTAKVWAGEQWVDAAGTFAAEAN